MLMPKKTKFRKKQKGNMKGSETRGAVMFGLKYSPTNPSLKNLLKLVWVKAKATPNTG